ncbi:MAG: efflux RND transporter permease subunit [Thermoanaerobaculia bacterium]
MNLPLALIGGVFAVAAGGDVLSIATAVGFFTLFGVAARNGVGNEINSPMAQVILGGLLTSTFLNLVLVPVLFAGKKQEDRPKGG